MPGAGKGTQAEIIERENKIPQISTGAILREVGQSNTPLGEKVQEFLSSGKLVPNEIIVEMLVDRISREDCKEGCRGERKKSRGRQGESEGHIQAGEGGVARDHHKPSRFGRP